ncbi:protein containing MORN repeat variant [Lentimicrobium saccharophilum]|uniref:Protein containing MORN repeat variant n=1 Tax=Lentimicrobium saccharophilum TaxID=1678841 RepID=A0A0S7BWW2_9BACT|nr:hypothetical protein [Lentimicrobium saccharophilum]GAP42222.1 protein containing MORN repeat variant [Lentimicrobium saccharophilum]
MKQFLFFFAAFLLLTSCNKPYVKKELFEDGSVKSEKTFKKTDGKEELLKEVVFHQNGKKYIEGNYKNGLREGYWASWYDDGTLWSEGEFRDGESHGKRSVFHPNGTLYYEGRFDMGKRVGVWKFYDENGGLVNEIDYDKAPEMRN